MRRAMCGSAAIVALVALMAASTESQTRRSPVRATRGGGHYSVSGSAQGQAGVSDPNMTAQQRMMQHRQEFEQRMRDIQAGMPDGLAEIVRQAREDRYKAMQKVLNATDEQWPRMKEKLDLMDRLMNEADVSVEIGPGTINRFETSAESAGGGAGSGSMSGGASGAGVGTRFARGGPAMPGEPEKLTAGQTLCKQLMQDLTTPGTPQEDIARKIAALRKIRAQARERLIQARKDLRALMVPSQEPALVAMGYLD